MHPYWFLIKIEIEEVYFACDQRCTEQLMTVINTCSQYRYLCLVVKFLDYWGLSFTAIVKRICTDVSFCWVLTAEFIDLQVRVIVQLCLYYLHFSQLILDAVHTRRGQLKLISFCSSLLLATGWRFQLGVQIIIIATGYVHDVGCRFLNTSTLTIAQRLLLLLLILPA